MNCDLTEKVSLLIDGELPPAEARAIEQHLTTCAECQAARADFLHLRRQISAYAPALSPLAQRHALAAVLSGQRTAATHSAVRGAKIDTRRWRARLFGASALPRFSPALATALALLVIACMLGLVSYLNAHRSTPIIAHGPEANAPHAPAPSVGPPGATPAPNINQQNETAQKQENNQGGQKLARAERQLVAKNSNEDTSTRANSRYPLKAGARQQIVLRQPHEPERLSPPQNEIVPSFISVNASTDTQNFARVRPADAGTLTARHVEQAGLLLRAFRNARTGGAPDVASDISYERRRAQQLLYENIVLRREAANAGDVQVATLLDSLEPILLDIANLPDNAHPEDVHAIRERVQRKNLVALLEVNSTALARAYD